jgi:hypothetical protein
MNIECLGITGTFSLFNIDGFNIMLRACITLTFEPSLKISLGVSDKIIRDQFFIIFLTYYVLAIFIMRLI